MMNLRSFTCTDEQIHFTFKSICYHCFIYTGRLKRTKIYVNSMSVTCRFYAFKQIIIFKFTKIITNVSVTTKYQSYHLFYNAMTRIGDVMVIVFASSAVDRGFEPWLGQTKDYKIGICCFSAKNAALRSKNKDWLVRNQNNVSEWSDARTGVSVSQHYKNSTQHVGLEQSGPNYYNLIEN